MRKCEVLSRIHLQHIAQVAVVVTAIFLNPGISALWGQSPPAFAEFVYSSDIAAAAVITADFNHDGIPDVAVMGSYAGPYALGIYLGRRDGSLQLSSTYSIGLPADGYLGGVVTGDFNGDGNADLVLIGSDSNSLATLIFLAGAGDGTFQAPIAMPLVSTGFTRGGSIAMADFNGDGKPDIVASLRANHAIYTAEILFLAGNGDGTFAPPQVFTQLDDGYAINSAGYDIAATDFNGDGNPDIAWLGNHLNVALGDGKGGFSVPEQYPVPGGQPAFLSVADFNADGVPDIVVNAPGAVSVYPGVGDGTFRFRVLTISSMAYSWDQPAIANFDGDGQLDVIVGARAPLPNLYLHGNGDGSFSQAALNLQFGDVMPEAWISSVVDMNGDGKPDVVFADIESRFVGVLLSSSDFPIALYPAAYDFGNQTVGANGVAQDITIGNTGATALTIGPPTLDNTTDFSVTTDCGTSIPAQGSCTASVTFQPQSTGAKAAKLNIAGAKISQSGAVYVRGNGIAPVLSASPAVLEFRYQKVGTTSASQTLQLTNSGIGPLDLSISVSGDFQQSNNCPSPLAEGASCSVTVSFVPEVPGSEIGRVTFNTNAIPAQSAVPLTGIGFVIGPILSISPASLDFGTQYVGTSSAPGVVTVQNSGDAPFNIISVTGSAGFVPLSTCGATVQPSFSCAIGVFFDPSATGDQTGTLSILSNLSATNPPITLKGTGTSISVGPSGSSSTSATIAAGQSVTYNMSVTPQSGYSGTVNLSCSGLPSAFTCKVSPSSVALNGSAAADLSVVVNAPASSVTAHNQAKFSGTGLLFLASPLAVLFLRRRMYSRWARRLLTYIVVFMAGGLVSSCGTTPVQSHATVGQTYTFLLQSQPATSITIDTPLTLTVQTPK